MKILCFILSMPKNNSWNNKWTGEKNLFARTKRITENKEIRQLKLFKTYRENRVWEGE